MDSKLLEALLSAGKNGGAEVTVTHRSGDWEPNVPLEATMMRLKEMADYEHDKFNIGDIVTVRADGGMKGVGIPHFVLRNDGDYVCRESEPGASEYLQTFDTLVAVLTSRDTLMTYWMPHGRLRRWTPEDAKKYVEKYG